MAFPHYSEVVLCVLVAVLHLDCVARELRFARACDVALIPLPRVAAIWRPMPLLWHTSHAGTHGVPCLMRVFWTSPGPQDARGRPSVAAKYERRRGNVGDQRPRDALSGMWGELAGPQGPAHTISWRAGP